jgi:hypothetical protein
MSETVVNRLADQDWCAAPAMPTKAWPMAARLQAAIETA